VPRVFTIKSIDIQHLKGSRRSWHQTCVASSYFGNISGDVSMRRVFSLATLVFATVCAPAFAAGTPKAPAPKVHVPGEIEMPEITIIMPAAKFEHAIVRDNEVPVVLLLV
jgi:hypothetical protein